eukprot:7036608-Prymnesium_polylepis.2
MGAPEGRERAKIVHTLAPEVGSTSPTSPTDGGGRARPCKRARARDLQLANFNTLQQTAAWSGRS